MAAKNAVRAAAPTFLNMIGVPVPVRVGDGGFAPLVAAQRSDNEGCRKRISVCFYI